MARVFITGSTQGLGLMAAEWLIMRGHDVVFHARNAKRAETLTSFAERGSDVVIGDLASPNETRSLADQVNAIGRMDAIIHNAGVVSGPALTHINLIAPYCLTALIDRPDRLIYLSSNDHFWGEPSLDHLGLTGEPALATYADTKLMVTTLAMAIARTWPDVITHAVDPGWVPTQMGGQHAPDDLSQGHTTQAWLAVGQEPGAFQSGHYWYHMKPRQPHHATQDRDLQDTLLDALAIHHPLTP